MEYSHEFNSKGYVLIPNFFSEEQSSSIVRFANNLQDWKEEAFKWMIYYESSGDDIKKKARIENFLSYHNELNTFITEKITPLASDIYGEPLTLFKEKLNWKLAGGKGFKAHQDQPAWTDFPCKKYVTVVLFADNSTIDNGCLEIAEVSEKVTEVLDYDTHGTGQLDKNLEESLNWNPITATPRDILLFDSYVIHRSDINTTKRSRRHFYFTYNPLSDGSVYDEYLKQKRDLFPPDIERDKNTNYNIIGNKYNLANPIK